MGHDGGRNSSKEMHSMRKSFMIQRAFMELNGFNGYLSNGVFKEVTYDSWMCLKNGVHPQIAVLIGIQYNDDEPMDVGVTHFHTDSFEWMDFFWVGYHGNRTIKYFV